MPAGALIKQSAGDVSIACHTGGWPVRPEIRIADHETIRVHVAALHDLRYCIDRVLAQLPPDSRP